MDDSRGSHLSVILDLSPTQWQRSAEPSSENPVPLSLSSFLAQLLAFLNAHVASKHENTLAVFGAFPGKSILLYSSTDHVPVDPNVDPNWYSSFKQVDTTVIARIAEEIDALSDQEGEAPCALVGALAKALCYVNRVTQTPAVTAGKAIEKIESSALFDPRILILSVSPDQATSYIPIMNAIFSAQKLKVTIDVCQLYGSDSVFLQQAAHLTGGSYILPERRDALLQYLIMTFLPSPTIRKVLSVPTQDRIDFRAACFCHKNIIDVGFVCSVCLSIFCQPVPVCSTCRTKFPMKTLQRLNASRPPTAAPTPRPSQSTPAPTSLPTNGSANQLPHSGSIRVDKLSTNGFKH